MMSTSTTQSLLTNPQVYEMKVRIVDVCTDWIDVYYVLSEQTTVLNSYIIVMSLDKVKNAGSPIYSQNIMVDDEYSDEDDFEKTNHIFILNSKINELNIVIQKMSLQFQQNLTEQKNLIENIKSEYQSREHALFLECQKAETIAQAEKQAKSIIAKQLKSTKNVL